MHVPDVEGLKDAIDAANASNTTIPSITNGSVNDTAHAATDRRSPGLGRASALLSTLNSTSRSTPAEKHSHGLVERQSCAKGKVFYACANGFRGCCSVNPCNPGQTCPDDEESSDASPKATGQADDAKSDDVSSAKGTSTRTADATTSTGTGIRMASPAAGVTGSMTPRPRPTSTGNPAPNCPRGNGTTYTDTFKIKYKIRCNADNAADSFNSVAVSTGGYDQCFSSCSKSDDCAGFTYVGRDSGDCYLKSTMPNATYANKAGNNYISCAKLNPNESSGNDPNDMSQSPGKKTPTGAIIGGVIGGIASLALLLFLVALCAKRRRKKIERRRATVTHVMHGPIETDMTANHHRQGSTSHDIFTPYGGNVYTPRAHTRQRSIYGAQTWV